MNTQIQHTTQQSQAKAAAHSTSSRKARNTPAVQLVDNRPETQKQREQNAMIQNGPQIKQAAQLQAMADNYTAKQYHPIQKKNNTGLPDNLKSGVENLSGISMDDVKVHYNSSQPAQLNAHAYAQGTDIHIAPGQEKHLPHEAWHVVQQKQGRVKPTMQMKGKVNVNDDAGLEREADVMGQKAMQLKASPFFPGWKRYSGSSPVVQRTPEGALKTYGSTLGIQANELAIIIANVKRIVNNFPLVMRTADTFTAMKGVVYRKVTALKTPLGGSFDSFVAAWNQDISSTAVEYYAKGKTSVGANHVHKPAKTNMPGSSEINNWYANKSISDKQMYPDLKLSRMLPEVLAEPEIPENVWVALKLFFAHTANFAPTDKIGRDFRSSEHGQYYRSSLDPVREGNSELLRENTNEWYDETGEDRPQGKKSPTYQVINQPLHEALGLSGKLTSNISDMNFFEVEDLSYAEYLSSAGSHTGALGLIQNTFTTNRVGTMVEETFQENPTSGTVKSTPVKKEPKPIVRDELLAPASDTNYHDLLLQDRAALIQEVSQQIQAMYGPSLKRQKKDAVVKITPIQSGEHASLIMELVYPDGYDEANKLTEKEWRETFIGAFNAAAKSTVKAQTRLTHRGSFGFLYPTASSVGGPVRIWPGLAPPAVFKSILYAALKRLPQHNPAFHDPEDPSTITGTSSAPTPTLHLEALKSAVKYAQQVIGETLTYKGPKEMFSWTVTRLERNLAKAEHILSMTAKKGIEKGDLENNYLKSTLVIENLMEYSYLLESLRADNMTAHDPYPEYVQQKLADKTTGAKPLTHTFYLDSGMQAIVTAHLLARNWIVKKKNLGDQDQLDTIDLYSYFEYGMVDRPNLNLKARNRVDVKGKGATYTPATKFKSDVIDKYQTNPSIIAADLNPVFTSKETSLQQVSYNRVFSHYAGQGKTKSKKADETVPIVDVTNASLDKVADLNLGAGYETFIIVESLSKHQQLGADKFTMGRLTAAGPQDFIDFAKKLVDPIARHAYHPLPAAYRLRMDRIFYGNAAANSDAYEQFMKRASQYNTFMEAMGMGEEWTISTKPAASTSQSSTDTGNKGLVEQFTKARELLTKAFELYKSEVGKSSPSNLDLEKAFGSLPSAEKERLLHETQEPFTFSSSFSSKLPQGFADSLGMSAETGIENVGNTCYLAAALNMIAFTPYYDLFAPRLLDPKANLRASVRVILDKIRAGTTVTYVDIAALLINLNDQRLLEAPIAGVEPRPLHAQRDPAEVMEYVLDYFGVNSFFSGQTLSQTYTTRMDLQSAQVQHGVDGSQLSNVDINGGFVPVTKSDWLFKLPVSRARSLHEAIYQYLQPEQLGQIRGVYNHQVRSGQGARTVSLGVEIPSVITIQLVRWVFRQGRVQKDDREVDMPHTLKLNNYVYTLTTIIYHSGASPESGHYTASTRNQHGNWQYRDDSTVYQDDNIDQHKNLGYIYTYVRTRQSNDQDNALLNFNNHGQPPAEWYGSLDDHSDESPSVSSQEEMEQAPVLDLARLVPLRTIYPDYTNAITKNTAGARKLRELGDILIPANTPVPQMSYVAYAKQVNG